MNKNLKRITFLFITIFAFADSINAQYAHRFSVSIAAGMSKTGSLEYSDSYTEFRSSPTINILTTGLSRNSNYNFSLGYQPIKSFSINGSIGVASYGFQYTGDVIASPTNFISPGGFIAKESFTTRLMEVGLSVLYRIELNYDLAFVIQPGIVWYTNPKDRYPQLLGINMNSNNFSATFFTGIEIPINNAFFASIGLNTKIALDNFNGSFGFDNKFHPFALGLQTSISYRFGNFRTE